MATPSFKIIPSGPIPDGWCNATCAEVQASLDIVKGLFDEKFDKWNICKLQDGKVSGPGYDYKIEHGDVTKEGMGHLIIIEKIPLEFKIASKGASLSGWRLATCKEVNEYLDQIKDILQHHQWYICALQDGSISGSGHNYELKQGDVTSSLGHMLLVKIPALEFEISPMGPVPRGWRIASFQEVSDHLETIKTLLEPHKYYICSLADGSISGPGHNYSIKQESFDPKLGHMLIARSK